VFDITVLFDQLIPSSFPISVICDVAEILIAEPDASDTVAVDGEILTFVALPKFSIAYGPSGTPRDVPDLIPEISSQYGFEDSDVANDTPPDPFACRICPLVAAPEEMAAVPTDPEEIFAATTALAASAAEPTAPASIFAATTDAAPSLAEVTEPSTI
jgi:hypothetical protein